MTLQNQFKILYYLNDIAPSKVDLCSADDILLAERGPELSEEAANSQLRQDTANN